MLLFPIWSHATKHGDVEEVNNIQPVTQKEADIIKPTVAEDAIEHGDVEKVDIIQLATRKESDIIKPIVVENVDSDLMVYSRRPRLSMQEQDPISLAHD